MKGAQTRQSQRSAWGTSVSLKDNIDGKWGASAVIKAIHVKKNKLHSQGDIRIWRKEALKTPLGAQGGLFTIINL